MVSIYGKSLCIACKKNVYICLKANNAVDAISRAKLSEKRKDKERSLICCQTWCNYSKAIEARCFD